MDDDGVLLLLGCCFDIFLLAGECLTANDTLRTLTLAPPAIVQNNSVLHPATQTNVVFIIV